MSCAFDTVKHSVLINKLSKLGIEGNALLWLQQYLSERKQSVRINGVESAQCEITSGVPQGSVLGPVLFSVYLNGIGKILDKHGISYVLFADDIQLVITVDPKQINVALLKLEDAICELITWLNGHSLSVNPSKTELLLVGTKQQISKCPTPIILRLNESSIQPSVAAVRNLGVWFDSNLSMQFHINRCCSRAFFFVRSIARMRRFLTITNRMKLVKSLVLSQLDYGSVTLHGIRNEDIDRMDRVIKAAVRMVLRLHRSDHISLHLKKYDILQTKSRIKLRTLNIIRKIINTGKPEYLREIIEDRMSERDLRSNDSSLLSVQRASKSIGERRFKIVAPKLWNDLPQSLRTTVSLYAFRNGVERLFLDQE
jgi:hypothetical protein